MEAGGSKDEIEVRTGLPAVAQVSLGTVELLVVMLVLDP